MLSKKNKKDDIYTEDKIAVWKSCITVLKSSIKDQAAQIAGGFVNLESPEFVVILECMDLNRRQIDAYRSLLEDAKNKN